MAADNLERDDLDEIKADKVKKSFVLYKNSDVIFSSLSDADAGRLIKSIFDYETKGVLPDSLPGMALMGFNVIRQYLDENDAKWRKTSKIRAEIGRNGGLATQEKRRNAVLTNKANASNCLEDKANQADIDIDIDIVTDTDIVNGAHNGERVQGAFSSPPPDEVTPLPFDWSIFKKMVEKYYSMDETHTSFSLEDVLIVFSLYFVEYENRTGKSHPHVGKKTIVDAINCMDHVTDEYMRDYDLKRDDYRTLIPAYFDTPMSGDRNIRHFFSGDIRLHRYQENIM